MKLSFLINLKSGNGRGQGLADQIIQLQQSGRFNARIRYTTDDLNQQDIYELLSYDKLVVVGGDGTVSRIVAQLLSSGHSELLHRQGFGIGVLATGTGNDLARELNVLKPFRTLPLFEVLKGFWQGPVKLFDVYGFYRESSQHAPHLFLNYVSIGFDGEVIEAFDRNRYRPGVISSLGRFGNRVRFGIESLKRFTYSMNLEPLKIIGDGMEQSLPKRAKGILVANIRAVMGIALSNKVGDYCDGKIECAVTRSALDYMRMIASNVLPINSLTPLGSFSTLRLEGLDPELRFQIDGEPVGKIASSWCEIKKIGSVPFCRGIDRVSH